MRTVWSQDPEIKASRGALVRCLERGRGGRTNFGVVADGFDAAIVGAESGFFAGFGVESGDAPGDRVSVI